MNQYGESPGPLAMRFEFYDDEGAKELWEIVKHYHPEDTVTFVWTNCEIKAKASVIQAWVELAVMGDVED